MTSDDCYFSDLPDPPVFRRALMPRGPEWLSNPPPAIKDGKGGVDFRLVRDLAKAGYKTYTLTPIVYLYKTMPTAIPVFVDWIEHIDERIPVGRTPTERDHKEGIWGDLNRNLYDPAAKGNRGAIEAVFGQFDKPWFPVDAREWAAQALDLIATKEDFDRMVALLDDPSAGVRSPVTHYLGRFRTDRSHDLLVHLLHNDPEVTQQAISALARMKRREDIDILRPYLTDSRDWIRRTARSAVAKIDKATSA